MTTALHSSAPARACYVMLHQIGREVTIMGEINNNNRVCPQCRTVTFLKLPVCNISVVGNHYEMAQTDVNVKDDKAYMI
jgi:hypothetical protein